MQSANFAALNRCIKNLRTEIDDGILRLWHFRCIIITTVIHFFQLVCSTPTIDRVNTNVYFRHHFLWTHPTNVFLWSEIVPWMDSDVIANDVFLCEEFQNYFLLYQFHPPRITMGIPPAGALRGHRSLGLSCGMKIEGMFWMPTFQLIQFVVYEHIQSPKERDMIFIGFWASGWLTDSEMVEGEAWRVGTERQSLFSGFSHFRFPVHRVGGRMTDGRPET